MARTLVKRTVRMSSDMAAAIDRARGDVPFERFARRAMEHECQRLQTPEERRAYEPLDIDDGAAGDGMIR